MLFRAPLSADRADALIARLDLPARAMALDVGCGQGELLLRIAARWGCQGLGVDLDAASIAAARTAAAARGLPVDFRRDDARLLMLPPVDLAVCIGASQAYGRGPRAWDNTLRNFSRLVRPGGKMLIGEGTWLRPPPPEYRALLGSDPGVERTHREHLVSATAQGLVVLHEETCSRAECDDFAAGSHRLVARSAAQAPDSPAHQERLRVSERWQEGYRRWGRHTLGFGFYLLSVPDR
jgi:SAM-dependent methyltransferase